MSAKAQPELRELPIGIGATGTRHETDSTGGIEVPADRYWGAQTQSSLKSGYIDEARFDDIVDPHKMVGDGAAGA